MVARFTDGNELKTNNQVNQNLKKKKSIHTKRTSLNMCDENTYTVGTNPLMKSNLTKNYNPLGR